MPGPTANGQGRFRSRMRIRPGAAFILGLALLIALGAGLLSLPAATPNDHPLPGLDAVFTATSAVCVTGLVVRDTGADFTPLGQGVILLLIQLGGLGVMAVAGTVSLLLGRGIGLRESSMLREVFEGQVLRESRQILRFIAVFTLVAEGLGTGLLWFGLADVVPEAGPRLWVAAFHAVSAFCNAGFALWSDSLVSRADNVLVTWTIGGLLVVGGLGFPVVANLRGWVLGRALAGRRPMRLFVQARVVLRLTAGLLLAGAALLLVLEWRGALAGAGAVDKIGLALFQSATARTAGFNTLDLTTLSSASLLVMMILMAVGAAPGSTAGGLKLTTVAALWANLRAIVAGGRAPRLFDREIGLLTVRRAFMILTTWILTSAVALFGLLILEGRGFQETLFEVTSAMGTVGLSLGLTPELSGPGRVMVIVLMFLGRLGPLAVAYGLVPPTRESDVRYPEANLLIG